MIENLIMKMSKWGKLGQKSGKDGSKVIGHIPRDFPEAYLHGFFAPRTKSDWKEYDFHLPQSLVGLYNGCNGLNLFLDCLSIFGIRSHYSRDASAQFQPFDLKDHDREHRMFHHQLPKGKNDNRVFFGSYRWDGSGIYATFDDLKIHRVERKHTRPKNTWANISAFLLEEYERLELLHSTDGYLIDENAPTTPN